ncbi:hypothetical protein EMIT0P260_40079 [Pseudomonas sp. IT-P260]
MRPLSIITPARTRSAARCGFRWSYRTSRLMLKDLQAPPMETSLETVALFSLKLAYEEEGLSPILRDDMVMGDYQKDVFELLVRRGDVETIQFKMNECLGLAMDALGGVEKPLGRELHKLSADFRQAQSLEQLDQPLLALKGYLKDIL